VKKGPFFLYENPEILDIKKGRFWPKSRFFAFFCRFLLFFAKIGKIGRNPGKSGKIGEK